MNKFMSWLEDSFVPKANKLFSRPFIAAFSSTMQKIIPFILTGSVIYFYNVIKSFVPVLPDLGPILTYSFGIITVIVAFMMGNQLMEKLGHPDYVINAGLCAVGTLLMVAMPLGDNADSISTLMGNLGAAGIAMVLVNVLKLDVYSLVIAVFMPLANIGQTLPGFILICLIPAFFYTLGISSWTFGAVTTPIFMAGIQANIDAVAAGGVATNIVTSESVFTMAFITMGGMCATLGLNALMCFSKSKQLKTLGRVFIIPSIFNINEPIMYGGKVVMNPVLMIPAWLNSIIGPVYVWILMSTGLLNIPSKMIQVGQIPAPICSVMITEDMRALLWWAVLFVIYLAVWFPFFKAYERTKLAEEAAENE